MPAPPTVRAARSPGASPARRARLGRAEAVSWVALLRGINVGGRSLVPMAALRQAFEALGHSDVRTYIASGNVVFRARVGSERELAAAAERALRKAFGRDIAVVVRQGAEVARVASANPWLGRKLDPRHLAVAFLADPPSAAGLAALDPDRSPPDAFKVVGREIYLHCPNGFARTRLTLDWFERKLGTSATARNWRTVTALAGLARPAS